MKHLKLHDQEAEEMVGAYEIFTWLALLALGLIGLITITMLTLCALMVGIALW